MMNVTETTNGPSSVVISLDGVSMSYGRRRVLTGVDLDIRRGDFVAVTGPNGGGKTTLMRIILRLLSPTSGHVRYVDAEGRDYPGLRIGYLPQNSAVDSHFPITVRDVVRLGLMGPGAPGGDHAALVSEMLECVELSAKASTPVGEISGGQFQRALLARAFVAKPAVLVLDEPLSYLDKHFEHRLYAMLDDIRARRPETAIVLVSHEMSEIAGMATRHVVVDGTLHICRSASHLVHYDCDCESGAE